MKKYIIPLLLSQVADVLSTALSMSQGGYEANPIPRFIIENGGLPGLMMAKLVIVFIAILVMQNAFHYGGRLLTISRILVIVVTAATFMAALWNVLVAVTAWIL